MFLQRQDELLKQNDVLRNDAIEQQDRAQIVTAQNLSLDDQLEKTKMELKAQKNFQIMATEKHLLEENLRIEKDHNIALSQELSKTMVNGSRIAKELQDSCHFHLLLVCI